MEVTEHALYKIENSWTSIPATQYSYEGPLALRPSHYLRPGGARKEWPPGVWSSEAAVQRPAHVEVAHPPVLLHRMFMGGKCGAD